MKKVMLLLLFVCMSAAAFADMTILQKVHAGPMMGQPAKDMSVTIYVKGKKERMDYVEQPISLVLDLESGKMYQIDHSKKEVSEGSLDMFKQMSGAMTQMTKGTKTSVTKTGKSDNVNGFKCDVYSVTTTGTGMMNMDGTMCVASSVDTTEFEPFKEFGQDMLKMLGGDELMKVKGLPVRTATKMTIMGQSMDSTAEVISVKHDAIPDAKFVIPADYKVTQMPMQNPHQ